jgi:hypothetical protein
MERNQSMEGIGQEYYTHACNLCCIVFEDEEGHMRMLMMLCRRLSTEKIMQVRCTLQFVMATPSVFHAVGTTTAKFHSPIIGINFAQSMLT